MLVGLDDFELRVRTVAVGSNQSSVEGFATLGRIGGFLELFGGESVDLFDVLQNTVRVWPRQIAHNSRIPPSPTPSE